MDDPRAGAYAEQPFQATRTLVSDTVRLGMTKCRIPVLIEVDVTDGRAAIEKRKAATGEGLSFTGWIMKCLAQAVSEHPRVHALRRGRRRLVLFHPTMARSKWPGGSSGRWRSCSSRCRRRSCCRSWRNSLKRAANSFGPGHRRDWIFLVNPCWPGQELFGVKSVAFGVEGHEMPGRQIRFTGALNDVSPQIVLTDFLVDLVYPIEPEANVERVATVNKQVVGVHRRTNKGGSATFLGFRPRDDQAASLGEEVRTWFEILRALGAHPKTRPDAVQHRIRLGVYR